MHRLLTRLLAALALAALGWTPSAQDIPTPVPLPPVTVSRAVVAYAGPGETHRQVGALRPGDTVSIIQRSQAGNWLRVQQHDRNGFVRLDGWVMTGALSLPPEVRFSRVPVNTDLPDANPAALGGMMAQLAAVPVIPAIQPAMREVYRRGQALGSRSAVITKVGDSLTANPIYLTPLSRDEYDLGPYDYLEDAVRYFGRSLAEDSLAARIGLNVYSVLDPAWSSPACRRGESPLVCEYRRKQPSVAFILFGPNDVRFESVEKYRDQMRQIIEETLARGIIPVLSTFSAHPDAPLWDESLRFNLALVALADEYNLPRINLWAAARSLPEYGLDRDRVHMKNSGFITLKFSTGHESLYGVSLRNLLSIRVLDEILHTIILESE